MGRRNPAVNLRVTERELSVLMSKVGYTSQYTTLRDKLVAASADMREAKRLKNREAKMARFRKSRQDTETQPESYPPDPYWGNDARGRFHYVDYDGEQLTFRFEENGDLWADKLGEGPVYIRKQDIPVIIDALGGEERIIEALRLEADLDAGINMATAFSGGAGTPVDKEAFARFYEAAHATKWLAARAEKKNDTQVITPL